MECHDYFHTGQGEKETVPAELVYKLNPLEIRDFVKLRMSNKDLFSKKKKNASMCGWRAILRHMGLQDKMTHFQAAKKWENMKKKYKEIKHAGVGSFPHWPYFTLMNDAIEGRLEGSAATLFPSPQDCHEVLTFPKRKRKTPMPLIESVVSMAPAKLSPTLDLLTIPEVEVKINGEGPVQGSADLGKILLEVDNEKHTVDRHKEVMERERLLLQRERAALDREVAALERDRASLDRDRAAIEREKTLLDRERAIVEKEREAVAKDRLDLEAEKARLVRSQDTPDNTENTDRKERFLFLFEKLINSF